LQVLKNKPEKNYKVKKRRITKYEEVGLQDKKNKDCRVKNKGFRVI